MDVELLKPVELCFKIFETIGLREISCIFIHFICFEGFLVGAVINLLKVDELWKILETLYVILRLFQVNIIIFKILCDFEKMEELAEKIKDVIRFAHDERFEDRKLIKNQLLILTKMLKLYEFSSFFVLTYGAFIMTMYHKLPFPIYNPLGMDNIQGFGFAALYQTVTLLFGCVIVISFNYLSSNFISLPIGLLKEVNNRLNLIDASEKFDPYELMKTMEIHRMIRKIVLEIQNTFGKMFCLNSVLNALILSCLIFVIFVSNEILNRVLAFFMSLAIILEIFIPCFFGQSLINASKCYSASFMKSKWMNQFNWKIISAFIRENRTNIKITCFNRYNLSLFTYLCYMNAVLFLLIIICVLM